MVNVILWVLKKSPRLKQRADGNVAGAGAAQLRAIQKTRRKTGGSGGWIGGGPYIADRYKSEGCI